jgi:hypothetical protein
MFFYFCIRLIKLIKTATSEVLAAVLIDIRVLCDVSTVKQLKTFRCHEASPKHHQSTGLQIPEDLDTYFSLFILDSQAKKKYKLLTLVLKCIKINQVSTLML